MDNDVSDKEKTKALYYCSQYLDGIWKQVSIKDVVISRLTGGMSNLLYLCALDESTEITQDEPRCVLLRLYGPSHEDTDLQITVFNKLSAEKLGPKLFASFDNGRLEEYMPSSALTWSEMTDDKISAVVASKIALIHKLDFDCLEKNTRSLTRMMMQFAQFVNEFEGKEEFIANKDLEEETRAIALKLIKIDFQREIDHLDKLFEAYNPPLVFSHNDLHQNNIILMHENRSQDLNERIVLIDFEYCSYNFRTFDLANHLSEWCFDYNVPNYPYFSACKERFPSEEIQRRFLSHYVAQMGPDDNCSGDILFHEMQPCLMASNLLWAIWAIKSAFTSKIKFGYWEMANCKWDIYRFCKNRYSNGDNVQSSKM